MSATTELKPPTSQPKGRVEKADSYLGIASKLVTVVAALSTVGFWLYSSFYMGTLELKTNVPIDQLKLRLYNDRGEERVFSTDLVKVTPGRYRVVVDANSQQSGQYTADVKFNQVTVLNHTVITESPAAADSDDEVISEKSNRKWWQFWRRK
jgi:hypothetical protein